MASTPKEKAATLPGLAPTKEGKIPFDIPSIDHPCFTYYKVFGDLDCGVPRLLVVHGGPGGGHEYLLPFAELWPPYGIPVVIYDQIGSASSTHLPQTDGDHAFWTESVFLNEVNNILDSPELGLRDGPGYHILGHSWGGMLASSFAGTLPRGLQRLVLASANASKELSARGVLLLRQKLPLDLQQVIQEKEEKREFDDPEYKAALNVFFGKYLYREPLPPELLATMKNMAATAVHSTCQGPSLPLQEGSLRNWTAIPGLPKITAPTLVYNGEFDTSHDISQQPFFNLIPRVRWITIANGTHMSHLQPELRERILTLVGDFLTPEQAAERE